MTVGSSALLVTSRPHEEVRAFFSDFEQDVCAVSGTESDRSLILPIGPISQIPPAALDTVRRLGMSASLLNGVVELHAPYEVCRVGETLSQEQSRVLVLLGQETATFRVELDSMWRRESEEVAVF